MFIAVHNLEDQSCLYIFPHSSKYMIFHIFPCSFTKYEYITNLQRYHLPVGLFGQLIERCTDIAEVMGSNPSQA